ncbi:MAG: hypothetical protein H7A21_09165 [Spirochaetales bacterium]|nr:hypothetical protein [Leptospiraceae bacterium]MCP5481589.1 hypothetical protein [Spirochaetales bacterium]MCP5484417.1 hypothetical protein [Spirochaetales bacterium]
MDENRRKYRNILLLLGALVFLTELLVRALPVRFLLPTEQFLIDSTRRKVESGDGQYRLIILGDSRSMSFDPGPHRDVYNFSLPGMGSRYFKFFLEKYLEAGNRKPDGLILAASPLLIGSGPGDSLVADPSLSGYLEPDMSMADYLYGRTIGRISGERSFDPASGPVADDPLSRQLHWKFFSQRYLFLFSPSELLQQYRGPEAVFLLGQSVPLLYATFKYRDAIARAPSYAHYQRIETGFYEPRCSCSALHSNGCEVPPGAIQDNQSFEAFREEHNGFTNIGNRVEPRELFLLHTIREKTVEQFTNMGATPGPTDFSVFQDFEKYADSLDIPIVYVTAPFPDYQRDSRNYREFRQGFEQYIRNRPHIQSLELRNQFMDRALFVDQVHLSCEGARQLNVEIQNEIIPRIKAMLNLDAPSR